MGRNRPESDTAIRLRMVPTLRTVILMRTTGTVMAEVIGKGTPVDIMAATTDTRLLTEYTRTTSGAA